MKVLMKKKENKLIPISLGNAQVDRIFGKMLTSFSQLVLPARGYNKDSSV
jgi:hypothetical protein